MVSFSPSEDEQSLLDTISRFAREELEPRIREADRACTVDGGMRGRYRELGGHLLGLPDNVGGVGFGVIAKVLAEEALAKVDAAQAVGLDDAGLAAHLILALGSDAQQQQWLQPLAQEPDYALAFAYDERLPGASLGYQATRAAASGPVYLLNGEKVAVYNADKAKHLVVLARINEHDGLAGLGAFVVDTKAIGVKIEPEDRMGLRAGRPCHVRFINCRVPAAARLQGENDVAALTRVFNLGRIISAARLVGSARGALAYAIEYAQDRSAFGKKICQHQGLAFFMADMEVATETARNLMLKAAWQYQVGENATVTSCNAIITACEAAVKVTVDSVQVFGGSGFMKDMPVERYMRDARALANMVGTSEDHVEVLGQALYAPIPGTNGKEAA